MKVKIIETGEFETLSLRDPRGIDWAQDLIGNHGGLNNEGGFWYNEITDLYEVKQEDFSHWEKIIEDNQALEYRLQELREEQGSEAVNKVIMCIETELEFHAAAVNKALNEVFGFVTV